MSLGSTVIGTLPIVVVAAPYMQCEKDPLGGSVLFWDHLFERRLFRLDARYGMDMFGFALATAVVDGRSLVAVGAPQTYGEGSGYVLLQEWDATGRRAEPRLWSGGGREIGSAVAISPLGRVFWLGRSRRWSCVATHFP